MRQGRLRAVGTAVADDDADDDDDADVGVVDAVVVAVVAGVLLSRQREWKEGRRTGHGSETTKRRGCMCPCLCRSVPLLLRLLLLALTTMISTDDHAGGI